VAVKISVASAAILAFCAFGPSGVHAQEADVAGVNDAIRRAFKQLLQNPGDASLNAEYAALQSQAGHFEEASSALLRLLLQNPNQPDISFQLGVLYYRMASYDLAQVYLEQAIGNPALTPALKPQAQAYLQAAKDRSQINRFFGSVTGGLRYQTNANAASSQTLQQSGAGQILLPGAAAKSDANLYISSSVEDDYDLQTQRQTTIVVTGSLYADRYFSLSRFDFDILELTGGVRFQPFPEDAPTLTVKPYAISNVALLAEDYLYSTGGAGLGIAYLIGDVSINFDYQARYRGYTDYANNPDIAQQSGWDHSGHFLVGWQVAPNNLLSGDLIARTVGAGRLRSGFRPNAYYELDFNLTDTTFYESPFKSLPGTWSSAIYVGPQFRTFEEADPAVSLTEQRHDIDWRFGAIQTVPVTDQVSGFVQVDQQYVHSNIVNYRFDDTTVTGGVTLRF
jgi:tetratricopeptide (TPR) repeat protein